MTPQLGFGVVALGFLLYALLPLVIPALAEPTLARVLFLNFSETVLLVIPWFTLLACLAIAILRHHLYEIDLLINRTLVYGTLSAGLVGLYVLVVGALGALFQSSGNLLLALVATGLAALLAQPLRARLQRRVNRLMYGERDDPYAVLSRLSRQLKTTPRANHRAGRGAVHRVGAGSGDTHSGAAAADRGGRMTPIRILIADDHPVFRFGSRALLQPWLS